MSCVLGILFTVLGAETIELSRITIVAPEAVRNAALSRQPTKRRSVAGNGVDQRYQELLRDLKDESTDDGRENIMGYQVVVAGTKRPWKVPMLGTVTLTNSDPTARMTPEELAARGTTILYRLLARLLACSIARLLDRLLACSLARLLVAFSLVFSS